MTRLPLLSLALILANSVVAQASVFPVAPGTTRLSLANWTPTHAGLTTVSGMEVLVSLEVSDKSYQTPEISGFTDGQQSRLPQVPVIRKQFRLKLSLLGDKNFRSFQPLVAKTYLTDNGNRSILATPDRHSSELRFQVAELEDGRLAVSFQREAELTLIEQGEFLLDPIPTTF